MTIESTAVQQLIHNRLGHYLNFRFHADCNRDFFPMCMCVNLRLSCGTKILSAFVRLSVTFFLEKLDVMVQRKFSFCIKSHKMFTNSVLAIEACPL